MQSERQAAPAAAGEGAVGAVSPLTSPGGDSYLKTEDRQRPRRPDASAGGPGAARIATPQGAGPMATSTESNPPAKDAKDTRGLSGLSESNLEQSILRRGLATTQEIDACKAHRAKLAASSSNKDEPAKSLLDIMVEAKVLTKNQSLRLIKEAGPEGIKKLEIPGYQILSKIGKGSMGVVYKAKQASVDRIVAVKILLDSLAKNKEFIKRFEREAKIAAKLAHNNVVNAIDAGQVDGNHFFVMEYVEGATIKDELDQGKIFDEKVAIRVMLAVAEALKHAHQRGLIHRDIKPENVILCRDGNVKLADLGLARLTADEKWAMAEAGMAIGTPYYISPEQVRGQVDVDIRADIYSLGATFYHMVTGKVPYGGETPSEVMRKHVDKNVALVPPDHINTRLSSGLGMVVETMLARNRENRYPNPDDLILDLKCLLQGEPPMIAGQKLDSLAGLAEGDVTDDAGSPSAVTDAEKAEMAAAVNAKTNIIAALGVLFVISLMINVLLLLVH
jgi:serine/threonine protein kinase